MAVRRRGVPEAGVVSVKRMLWPGAREEAAGGKEDCFGGDGSGAGESLATIRNTRMVFPQRTSSPFARVASFTRVPLRKVPLLLPRSRTRQPLSSHSKAQ